MTDYIPPVVEQASSIELWTFADVVRHLIDTNFDSNRGRVARMARRAALEAYREFPDVEKWQYLKRVGQVTTSAAYSEGSISYDHAGGAEPRLVTLVGGTWPDDIASYSILVGNRAYPVESFIDGNNVTLGFRNNPGEDVASTSSYYAFRDRYPVPFDFRSGTDVIELNQNFWPTYVAPEDVLQFSAFNQAPQDNPWYYTIAPNELGGLAFWFSPPPLISRRYDFVYRAGLRPMKIFGGPDQVEYTEGTVDVSGANVSKAATDSSGLAWTADMVGCVFRLAPASSAGPPTGMVGDDANDNPYTAYRIVKEFVDSENLVLDSAPGDLTGAYYSIGSAVDLEPGVMLNCFLHMAEYKMAQYSRQSSQDQAFCHSRYIESLKMAMAADNRGPVHSASYSIIDWVMNAPLKYLERT